MLTDAIKFFANEHWITFTFASQSLSNQKMIMEFETNFSKDITAKLKVKRLQ